MKRQEKRPPENSSAFRVLRFRSIHEIDEGLWDAINAKEDLFHTHRFIRSVENGGVEGACFWYLLFYQGDRPVGAAVLSSFPVSLDLLMGRRLQKVVKNIRRWFPHFLRITTLFCGLPVSIGKNTLSISEASCGENLIGLLVNEMVEIGRQEKIKLLCVKEFLEGDAELLDPLARYRFFRSHSLPCMKMEIRWKDFESYLAEMRHDYRRLILRSLKKLGQSKPFIEVNDGSRTNPETPLLILLNSGACPPGRFYELYLNVMEQAKIKLEILSEAFFENLHRNLNDEIDLLAVVKGREVLAAALLTVYRKRMTFLLAGLDYSERDEYDVYFNLVYGIVSRAMERGCESLDLGQTPYWVKQRIGAEAIPVHFYMRDERWYLHHLLKAFRLFLFPEMKPQRLRVFR